MTTTSDARKRLAEATDQHAACIPGQCRAGQAWVTVGCAGGGGDVEAIAAVIAAHRRVGRLGCTCGRYFEASAMDDVAMLTEHDDHVAAALAAQRPEGVTVTEWGHRYPDGSIIPDSSETVAKSRAAISRVRGNSPLVLVRRNVTEWAEVSGDMAAGDLS